MSFKQYLREEITRGLDETYREEHWAKDFPGKAYFDVHLSTIEEHERAAATFREYLGAGGMRILESGCGTGRWMAYFEKLNNRAVGVDDSWGPLRVAREHDPDMRLVRGNVLHKPFLKDSFDAVFSSYVAEHFPEGPEALFREIHRVLKPNGLFFVVVPFNNVFRRLVVNPTLRLFYALWRLQGRPLGFTEFRYSKAEMDGFLARSGFEVVRVLPDDYFLPWSKGLFVDLCDVGSFVRYEHKPPYEFGRFGTTVVRLIQSVGIWRSCEGIFYVARARK
jgi:ubiquinone/menaquinone biosynthesis C-methylase UbiE